MMYYTSSETDIPKNGGKGTNVSDTKSISTSKTNLLQAETVIELNNKVEMLTERCKQLESELLKNCEITSATLGNIYSIVETLVSNQDTLKKEVESIKNSQLKVELKNVRLKNQIIVGEANQMKSTKNHVFIPTSSTKINLWNKSNERDEVNKSQMGENSQSDDDKPKIDVQSMINSPSQPDELSKNAYDSYDNMRGIYSRITEVNDKSISRLGPTDNMTITSIDKSNKIIKKRYNQGDNDGRIVEMKRRRPLLGENKMEIKSNTSNSVKKQPIYSNDSLQRQKVASMPVLQPVHREIDNPVKKMKLTTLGKTQHTVEFFTINNMFYTSEKPYCAISINYHVNLKYSEIRKNREKTTLKHSLDFPHILIDESHAAVKLVGRHILTTHNFTSLEYFLTNFLAQCNLIKARLNPASSSDSWKSQKNMFLILMHWRQLSKEKRGYRNYTMLHAVKEIENYRLHLKKTITQISTPCPTNKHILSKICEEGNNNLPWMFQVTTVLPTIGQVGVTEDNIEEKLDQLLKPPLNNPRFVPYASVKPPSDIDIL